MKRKTLKFFACAAIMAMTLSFTACGGSDDTSKTAETGAKVEDQAAEPEKEEEAKDDAAVDSADQADDADDAGSDASASGTLEDLYNDPSVKSMLDSAFDSMAGDGMSLSMDVTGNEMIMEVKFEDSSMVVDGIGEALGEALDQQADSFKQQVKTFDDAVGQEGACTVTMRYLDPDGNVLVEKSYKAQ